MNDMTPIAEAPSAGAPEDQDIVYALAASPRFAQDGVAFAACQSGLYRSRDGGHTWKEALASLDLAQPLAVTAVAISPDFRSDHTVLAGAQGGVLLSTDSGRRWTTVLLPPPAPNISSVAFSPNFAEDGCLFLGTLEDGLFRSTDRGRHWSASNFGLLDLNLLCLALSPAFAADETLAVGAESGLYQSTNAGRSWRELEFPLEWAPVLSVAYSPNYASDGTLFAGSETSGLLRSLDRGLTWTRLGKTALAAEVNAVVPVAAASGQLHLLALLPETLVVSRNAGRTWAAAGACDPDGTFTAVVAPAGLAPSTTVVAGLSNGCLLYTKPSPPHNSG
jgi:photosystem II stability/assembly factor-like uncharacterized protein